MANMCCVCGDCQCACEDRDSKTCESCDGFICERCLNDNNYVMFCFDCAADCNCNKEVEDAYHRHPTRRNECEDCKCKHDCLDIDSLGMLCIKCANPPAPAHTDTAMLDWLMANIVPGWTRALIAEQMPPPPDTRYKRPCAQEPEEGEIAEDDAATPAKRARAGDDK